MVRSIGFIFCVAAAAASIAYLVSSVFALRLPNFFDEVYGSLSSGEQLAFTQAAAMHETSYDAAGVATLVAAAILFWKRRPLVAEQS